MKPYGQKQKADKYHDKADLALVGAPSKWGKQKGKNRRIARRFFKKLARRISRFDIQKMFGS